MEIHTIPACPICSRDVSGNTKLGYLCRACSILFPRRAIRRSRVGREQLSAFVEYVKSEDGDVYHVQSCKYAKRINEPEWIKPSETTGLRACKCVKLKE